jgi:hypothetical protein
MKRFTVSATTLADGTATVKSPVLAGELHSIQYVPDGVTPFDNTADFVVTSFKTGETLLSKTNVAAAFKAYPREAVHDTAGVAATLNGTVPMLDRIGLARDQVQIAIAQGGNVKKGKFEIVIADD